MRVTLKDIATRVGVTKTTISMALRNNPRVSQAMRETIKRVAGEMGYVPDPFLKRLAEYRHPNPAAQFHGVIAWLNRWEKPERLRSYHEFEQYWQGAKQASKRLGYRLEEFVWPIDLPDKLAEQRLLERHVLGLLIPPHGRTQLEWGDFDWNKFSVIRFGMSVPEPDSNLVTADHQRAVVMAIKKIHECGYRRIGLAFNEAHDRSMGGNFIGGYLWAQKLLKLDPLIPPMTSDFQKAPQDIAKFKAVLDRWMKCCKPDAILNGFPEVPAYLQELGYRIPEDVAVAGTSLDDVLVDAGIDQHSKAIGKIAAEMVIKQIGLNERGEPSDPCRILVESRWREGRSLPFRG
jgi:DNA-binding LacI/PurR family transcriptional regulator